MKPEEKGVKIEPRSSLIVAGHGSINLFYDTDIKKLVIGVRKEGEEDFNYYEEEEGKDTFQALESNLQEIIKFFTNVAK